MNTANEPSGKRRGLSRLYFALRHSIDGFVATARHEAAFRQELIAACLLIPLACWLDVTRLDRVLMISSVLLVLIVEIVNSAIESTIDRIGPERHELSGRAKDQGSAAVLLAIAVVVVVWVSALWPLWNR